MTNRLDRRPRLECLEDRTLLSWGATPPRVLPPGGDRINVVHFETDGAYHHTARINRREIDSYRFTAVRTGVHTFTAVAASPGSKVDTVIGLFNAQNRRLAFNDDAPGGNGRDSQVQAALVAGQTYRIAVTNFRATPNGAYTLAINPPPIAASATDFTTPRLTSATATLLSKTLTITVSGATNAEDVTTYHWVRFSIKDASGRSIGPSGELQVLRTVGSNVLDGVRSDTRTETIDYSDYDLSGAASLHIEVFSKFTMGKADADSDSYGHRTGSAQLARAVLTITLNGSTSRAASAANVVHTHHIRVYISSDTGATLVPTIEYTLKTGGSHREEPYDREQTWTIPITGVDLARASRLSVQVFSDVFIG